MLRELQRSPTAASTTPPIDSTPSFHSLLFPRPGDSIPGQPKALHRNRANTWPMIAPEHSNQQLPETRPRSNPLSWAPGVMARAIDRVLGTAHRCLDPLSRERFLERPAPTAPQTIAYRSDDQWHCFLHRCPPPPGSIGEPLLLAHGLGLNRFSLDYHGQISLVRTLHKAGFDVYLLETRANASAFPPRGARPFDADTIAAQDIPAAIHEVLSRTGFSRVGWLGHGLGGQLLYLHMVHDPDSPIFAAVTLGAACRFDSHRASALQWAIASRILPRNARLPVDTAIRAISPLATESRSWTTGLTGGSIPGPRLRGLMNHAFEQLNGGLLRQVGLWLSTGSLCDSRNRLDYVEAMQGLDLPLLILASPGDDICPPETAAPPMDRLTGPCEMLLTSSPFTHLDLVQSPLAAAQVWEPAADWLKKHRKAAW